MLSRLYEDELVLVCNPQHRFARRGQVELAEVGRERLVMFDRTSSYFELTQSLFLRGGVVAHTVMELDNIEAAKKMVEEGLGVALLPRVSVMREISSGALSEIEVADAPPMRRSVDAIRRKDAGSPWWRGARVFAGARGDAAAARAQERAAGRLTGRHFRERLPWRRRRMGSEAGPAIEIAAGRRTRRAPRE